MTYVMSDIHGQYDLYRRMLEKIGFSPNDNLYILGDVIDRSTGSIQILLDMMGKDNVFLLAGNHEYTAIGPMRYLAWLDTGPAENENTLDAAQFSAWMENAGETTLREFCKLAPHLRREVADYVGRSAIRTEIAVGSRMFHLSHTLPDEPLWCYAAGQWPFTLFTPPACKSFLSEAVTDYLSGELDYGRCYGEGKLFITGHTPTHLIDETYFGRIWQGNGHIAIDCAAAYGGNLACLCLDTMREYYIK